MSNYDDFVKKNNLIVKKCIIKNSAIVVETDKEKLVLKNKFKDKKELFNYLESRGFIYFPKIIVDNDNYEVYSFIEDVDTPKEQKAEDIIYLMSLLHNKTTFYKERELDKIKAFYESKIDSINYLLHYYEDLQVVIENNIYMAPSEYLLIRNISFIYNMLSLTRSMLEEWYKLMSKTGKRRYVLAHHNLLIKHYLKDKQGYFISWDQADFDIPIYDFYLFYIKNRYDLDIEILFEMYKAKYPLLREEELELYILLSLPNKLILGYDELLGVKEIYVELERLKKALRIISKSNKKYSQEEKEEFNNQNKDKDFSSNK
ncbi:MAG: hypothetical protein RR047_03100 [Bacilli bacterium]